MLCGFLSTNVWIEEGLAWTTSSGQWEPRIRNGTDAPGTIIGELLRKSVSNRKVHSTYAGLLVFSGRIAGRQEEENEWEEASV